MDKNNVGFSPAKRKPEVKSQYCSVMPSAKMYVPEGGGTELAIWIWVQLEVDGGERDATKHNVCLQRH